ncbi:MAG: glycosyltransferase [Planctomycetes bacterium]|nr:glycosyltransferase [Planctomycetota bacterium]
MSLIEAIIFVLYFGTLAALSVYGVHRCCMLWWFFRNRGKGIQSPANVLKPLRDEDLPAVTLQLPIYNERYVVERVINQAARLDYPRDRLEIQVLDDSTDDTTAIAERLVHQWRARGLNIVHIHRVDRTGYKAGALKNGLSKTKNPFVAILDADFVPAPEFLRQIMPGFTHDRVGVVQARWGHLNRNYSVLTRAQSILLDGHFVIEHTARNRTGRFFNFNGTAGVWRRSCLEDAGGWEHDTLTEDLDLSYRAQLKGWNFVYLPDIVVPAELPAEIHGFKSQQHRWAKGSIQTAIKLTGRILGASIPLKAKVEAISHLSANLCYPLLLLLSLLLMPGLWIRTHVLDPGSGAVFDISLFAAASLSIVVFYLAAQREIEQKNWWRSFFELPVVFALGIGLSVNNSAAVLEALIGHETPFVRTPKHAITGRTGTWRGKSYFNKKTLSSMLEVIFGIYLSATVVYMVSERFYVPSLFVTLFAFGYLYIGFTSLAQAGWRALLPRRVREVRVLPAAIA